MKPFRVSAEWVEYAHGSGAESGQKRATELVNLSAKGNSVEIPVARADLVEELISVAELYMIAMTRRAGGSAVQSDDRLWFRTYPFKLVTRGRTWLRERAQEAKRSAKERRV